MKADEITNWALVIISHVQSGRPTEDSKVELKASWLPPKQIARQLAGHANAAYGENILWLIGVDQKSRLVPGADNNELSNWYPQLQKEFDGNIAPALIADVNIVVEGRTVVALVFDTSLSPFVVKVPDTDRLEIPWREGTRTRSATRSDLLKVYSVQQSEGRLLPLKEFATESPRARKIAIERPDNWEYLITIELLKSKLSEVRRNYNDVERGLAFKRSRTMRASEFSGFVNAKMRDLELLLPAFTVTLEEEIPASWGVPGEAGDAMEIKRAVDRLITACNELVEWESDLVSVHAPEVFENVALLMRGLTSELLSEIERFVQELSKPFEQPNPAGEYNIKLKFDFPEDKTNQISEELLIIRGRISNDPSLWT